ncbi:MAG: tetratricopeptide repeat protein [Myxococcales bacterium]|nr:tetratricopeptide repeat protein [Myxococcales bacterium]
MPKQKTPGTEQPTVLARARQAFEKKDFGRVEKLTDVAADALTAENAELLLLRVQALAGRGRVRAALGFAEAVLEKVALGPDLAGTFRCEQARLLIEASRHDSALRAVELGQAVAHPEERRQLEIIRAVALSGRGDQEMAREFLESIARNARAENRPDLEAEVLSRLMLVAHRSADHARLEDLGHRVIEINGPKDTPALGRAHRYLAVACGIQQRYPEALDHHRRALQIFRCLNDPLGLARERLSLGLHYIDMGEPELAEFYLSDGLKMAERCEDLTLLSTAFARLGTFALSQGKPDQTLDYFQRDLALTRETEAVHNRAYPLRNIGRALTLLGRFKEAERRFAESTEAFETVHDAVNVALTMFDWAIAKSATPAGAKKALALVNEGRETLQELGRGHMLPHADIAESHAHFRLGEIDRAEALFDRAVDAWLAKQNLARVAESALRFGNALTEVDQLERATRVLQKGLNAAIRGSHGELVRRFVARITALDKDALVQQPIRSSPDFALSDAETAAPARTEEIVGASTALESVRDLVGHVAPTDVPVLITGESGVGKELVARAIHGGSSRRTRPLVIVNGGATPRGLSRRSCSDTRKALSRTRYATHRASSFSPTAAPPSSTRSATSPWRRRSRSCASSSRVRSRRWATRPPYLGAPTSASSRRPTRTSCGWRPRGSSVPTCCSG